MLPRTPLLLIGWSLCLAACSLMAPKFERPTLSVTGIELVNGNLLQQHFRVKFNIQNPNDRALPVSGLHAALSVAGENIAAGQDERAFLDAAKGDAEFELIITAHIALALLKAGHLKLHRAATIAFDLSRAPVVR